MQVVTPDFFEWQEESLAFTLAPSMGASIQDKSCPICGKRALGCDHDFDQMARAVGCREQRPLEIEEKPQVFAHALDVAGYRPPIAECDAPVVVDNPKDAIGSSKAPTSTLSEAVLAEVGVGMMEGSLKYGRHNYRVAAIRAEVYYDAVHRHLRRWWAGEDIDADSGLSHITKAICTLFVLRDCMITGQLKDDRPPGIDPKFFDELDAKASALVKKYPNPKAPVTAKDRVGA